MAAAAGRVRVLSVGEKLMRAGSDGILNRHKSLRVAVPQDKAQSETLTERQALNQSPGERGENMGMVPPKSRISPPKASTQHQGSVHSKSCTKRHNLIINLSLMMIVSYILCKLVICAHGNLSFGVCVVL